MWTRRELKEKAKQRLRMNYWKCILAALVLSLISGGIGVGARRGVQEGVFGDSSAEEEDISMEDTADYFDYVYLDGAISSFVEGVGTTPDGEFNEGKAIAVVFFLILFFMILCIALVIFIFIVLPLHILLINPLEVGIRRFFTRNLREQANIREICYTFDHSYKNSVKIQFFRGWYTFLWSLLLVIPGIVKSYEYKMIPYLLGEYPDISMEEAFAQSRSMMYGNKWRAFVLDFSFLGWYILSGLTFGILGIFYVGPYVYQTRAALYQKLKAKPTEQFESMPYQG